MKQHLFLILVPMFFSLSSVLASTGGVYLLPMNCAELLPDSEPYRKFFSSVALGQVGEDTPLAKRMLKVLALREQVEDVGDYGAQSNPVDVLVRKTLCYFREQKSPTTPVTYNDAKLVGFLKSSLNELESRVTAAILEIEKNREQRKQYESQLELNEKVIENLQQQAGKEAQKQYNDIAQQARKQIKK